MKEVDQLLKGRVTVKVEELTPEEESKIGDKCDDLAVEVEILTNSMKSLQDENQACELWMFSSDSSNLD